MTVLKRLRQSFACFIEDWNLWPRPKPSLTTTPDGRPALSPAELGAFIKAWPQLKAATRDARKAGFKVFGALEFEHEKLLKTAYVATRGGISTVDELEAALKFDCPRYFGWLIRPPEGRKAEPWAVDQAFIFHLLVIRAVAERIDEDTLYEAGWHPSMARRAMTAARADLKAAASN